MIYYLATPYASFPDGINQAHAEACNLTGRLILKGYRIYSPIVHCHAISMATRSMPVTINPTDKEFWFAYHDEMMEVCDALMVGMLPSWKRSMGVIYEIDRFERDKKPIFFVKPSNLRLRERRGSAGSLGTRGGLRGRDTP